MLRIASTVTETRRDCNVSLTLVGCRHLAGGRVDNGLEAAKNETRDVEQEGSGSRFDAQARLLGKLGRGGR